MRRLIAILLEFSLSVPALALTPYTATYEAIKTKGGSFDTVKYRRYRTGSSRSTLIWFAAELEYLPVRMQHFNKDKSTGTVNLERYTVMSSD
jgi:hypothetical protein